MRDIKFDVMFKDEKVASITVKDNTVHALTYTDIRYKQPFNKIVSLEYIERFLEDRCIPRNRQNINELLVNLGLENYDVIEILKKTHGISFDDFWWIKFENEDLNWKDVKVRE